jgi:hypothetical protein
MSTPPRDAGIPMLTEVIEEDGMDFVGPPSPEAAPQAQAAADTPPEPAAPEPVTAALSAAPMATPAGGGYASPQTIGIQYGPPAQFAPSYPLPLKPAASLTLHSVSRETSPIEVALTPAAPMDEDEWLRMERRLRERILGQLLARTDAMLEERIRSSVAGVLEQAVDNLAATLRASLHKTLEDVVSRAVAQEISRLQSTKK